MSGLSFLKLMIIIEHIKMMETPYLDIYYGQCFSGRVPHTSYSKSFFWILRDNTVLEENNLLLIMY